MSIFNRFPKIKNILQPITAQLQAIYSAGLDKIFGEQDTKSNQALKDISTEDEILLAKHYVNDIEQKFTRNQKLYQEELATQQSNIEDRINNRTPSKRLVNDTKKEVDSNQKILQEELATQKSNIESRRNHNKAKAEGWEFITEVPAASSADVTTPSWVERSQAKAQNDSQYLGF